LSRYDWGQTHPGIERLEKAVTEARDGVVRHPRYAGMDTHDTALAARAKLWDDILTAIKNRADG